MPTLSVVIIRTALVYFLLGLTVGSWLLMFKGTGWIPGIWRLLPAHIEWMLFGWTFQLIMGVAFWMFPRMATGPKRGNEALVVAAYLTLNLGVWLVVLSDVYFFNPLVSFSGRLLELASVVFFVLHLFPRVKPFGA